MHTNLSISLLISGYLKITVSIILSSKMITGDEKSDSDEAMCGHQMTSTCGIDLNEKYNPTIGSKIMIISMKLDMLLKLNHCS